MDDLEVKAGCAVDAMARQYMFEKIPLDQLLNKIVTDDIQAASPNQLNLFN